jgi:hypothetical protein
MLPRGRTYEKGKPGQKRSKGKGKEQKVQA